jgi:hypothetical protein
MMAHYSVSFELKSDAAYGARYSSLMEQIRKAPSKNVWTETTSFALVETTETLDAFADRLYLWSAISASTDKLLVIDHLNGKAVVRGTLLYPNTLGGHFYSCIKK